MESFQWSFLMRMNLGLIVKMEVLLQHWPVTEGKACVKPCLLGWNLLGVKEIVSCHTAVHSCVVEESLLVPEVEKKSHCELLVVQVWGVI